MTLIQLEYITALHQLKHFAKAAAHCHITQPSLSMQVQKLEEELGITIFDRSKQPVVTTQAGEAVIEQAQKILSARDALLQQVQHTKGLIAGELRIGIIPTLAPYLLPLFIKSFIKKYPAVKLIVQEMMTQHIIQALREGRLDAGILVSPLQEAGIQEHVLFYESLMVYVSKKHAVYNKTYVLPQDIDADSLWLLEEGHCFRSQIANLCELKKQIKENNPFEYEAGSIETLRRMVEINEGITIIPELATQQMNVKEMLLIRHFKKPEPMREVSLVVHRNFIKQKLIEVLKEEIVQSLPQQILKNKPKKIVPLV